MLAIFIVSVMFAMYVLANGPLSSRAMSPGVSLFFAAAVTTAIITGMMLVGAVS